jgi:aerobic carbon-monoxide dehydrogenase small subunit
MILAAHSLLQHTLTPTREDIVEAISGNICRCTGYGQIIEAIEFAAARLRVANTPHPHRDVLDRELPEHDAPAEGVLEAEQADQSIAEAK